VSTTKKIATLIKKDLLTEVRQQYAFYGVVLYVAVTCFILYIAISQPEKNVWNGLFWTIQLFVCVTAVAKSFLQESRGRMLYYYTISSGSVFIIAKLIFNSGLMLVMSLISWGLTQLLMGSPVQQNGLFLFVTVFGSISLGLVFTILSAIAAKAGQNAALMAIMGFPLVIPLFLVLIKLSNVALNVADTPIPWALLAVLVGYDILVIILSLVLFPFVWKD
jgi:heme exporter protein B